MTPPILQRAVAELAAKLGDNLYSCCLYGSAVRGNLQEGVSDLNILIVLKVSDSSSHELVAECIGSLKEIDPFILGQTGFARSVRAFAAKFASIKRNYRVLHGADPLAEIDISQALERFLCEQALRNLRLRMVYAYTTRARDGAYGRFLVKSVTPMFLRFSEVLRLEGIDSPSDFADRIAGFERHFGFDGAVLRELLEHKQARNQIPESDAPQWHAKAFPIVDTVLHWVEKRWSDSSPV